MNFRHLYFSVLLLFVWEIIFAGIDIRQTVILNENQQQKLYQLSKINPTVRGMWNELRAEADIMLSFTPQPLAELHYDSYSNSDPKRIKSEESLMDMDCLAVLYYAIICSNNDTSYINKAKEFILSWSSTYLPTGNPINEGMLESLFHTYLLAKQYFSIDEQKQVENWLIEIADKERNNDNLTMSQSETKRIKTMGTLGYILNDPDLVKYTISSFKQYVEVSLYPDGTSYELNENDLLSEHIYMLEPLLSFGITFRQFEGSTTTFDIYTYKGPNEASVKKSVDYVIPYAKGNKKKIEKPNQEKEYESTIGNISIENRYGYQFQPITSAFLFEMAIFYSDTYKSLLPKIHNINQDYYSWVHILVSVASLNDV